ncbi:hypothetical protein FE697_007595 [Mumia zhuanghuii]|uniref:DUF2567 domain-containing protein n=2 Tax=Mumia TaxID=1546255 RepID=A0ABW1QN74_9ACTN|nr:MULTISPECIES: hypothetical protein [Mumia]KAA1423459.1 hypothetical protein FE697_007595 [Mumia zhuanghuii]
MSTDVLPERRTGTVPRRGRPAIVVGFLVAGVLAGLAWAWLADPIQYVVVRVGDQSGLSAGEEASTAQFGVIVTYTWIGAIAAALWGAVATWRWGRDGTTVSIALTALGAALGAFVAWGVGVVAGPPEPTVGEREAGALVSAQLEIDAYGVLFVWPVAALLAFLLVCWAVMPRERAEDAGADEHAAVTDPADA